MSMIVEMAKAELERHKLRTALTIIGVVIGIFLITTMVSFTESINVMLEENIGVMSGKITVMEEGVDFMTMMQSEIDAEVVQEIEQVSGVERVAPMFAVSVQGYSNVAGMNLEDLDIFEGINLELESGSWYEDDANEVVIGILVKERQDYDVGDTIALFGENLEVVGVMESVGNPEDDNSLFTSIETAWRITGREDVYLALIVETDIPEDSERIARDIEDLGDLQAYTDKDLLREFNELMGQVNVMLYSVGGIASVIAAIVIMNVMFMSVRERTKEIGAMKAIGATDLQILTEIIGEAMFIAFVGGIIGLFLAYLATLGINSMAGVTITMITPRLVGIALMFSLLLGLTGGILPARRAAKLDPIVALRYE